VGSWKRSDVQMVDDELELGGGAVPRDFDGTTAGDVDFPTRCDGSDVGNLDDRVTRTIVSLTLPTTSVRRSEFAILHRGAGRVVADRREEDAGATDYFGLNLVGVVAIVVWPHREP